SLLWWYKRLIALRKRYRAFGRGTVEFLHPSNPRVLAFVRRYDSETILVVANLSRNVQTFELDLSAYRGFVPVELSGGTRFPEVADRPYFLNLGPFAFYWFSLERVEKPEEIARGEELPLIGAKTLEEVLTDRNRDALSRAILRYLQARRWFASKTRTIAHVRIREQFPLPNKAGALALIEVEYTDGEPDLYQLPLGVTQARRSDEPDARTATLIARLRDGCLLYEPVTETKFANSLLDTIGKRKALKADRGTLSGVPARAFKELRGTETLEPQVLKAEQSNTAIVYDQKLFLKLFRRLEPGVNTDLEVTRFLNEETDFQNVPRLAGALEHRIDDKSEPTTLAILQGFTENAGDAWRYTLDAIGRYFERLLSDASAADRIAKNMPSEDVFALAQKPLPDLCTELLSPYLSEAELLGKRTAELHLALASRDDIPAFAPEPFTPHYQRSIYETMRTQAVQTLALVKRRAKDQPEAQQLLAQEKAIQQRLRKLLDNRISGQRIRTHGDYHLGQVLYTGNDFVIIDFEGEPSRPLSERRIKRSALRDVAGMLRSFSYAPWAVIFGQAPGFVVRPEDRATLEAGAQFWQRCVSAAFLRSYLATASRGSFLPPTANEQQTLLEAYLLEKALYEIGYELNNRPDWIRIPLRGVLDLLH
ncbi:MAG: putative maltokinase, partial [Acidobacteria bacterium]|nr:putative maltokinase [Acidobacteriota bacterium]